MKVNKLRINIRTVEETDFAQLIELFKEFAAFEKLPDKMVNSIDRLLKEKEYFNCFVAETQDKKIIGFASYFFSYYTWIGKSIYLDDLYVKPEYRANGIGTRLINQVIEFAKSTQCHKLRWQVSEWNKPAIHFYKKMGATIDNVEMNCDLILD